VNKAALKKEQYNWTLKYNIRLHCTTLPTTADVLIGVFLPDFPTDIPYMEMMLLPLIQHHETKTYMEVKV
jgi:hypothetical protein